MWKIIVPIVVAGIPPVAVAQRSPPDPRRGTSPGTIPIGGKIEFAESDRRGRVYVKAQNTAEIAVLDVATRRVVTRLYLPTAKFHLTLGGIAAAPGTFRILVLDGKG